MYDAFVLNARNNGLIPRLALNRKKAPFKSSRRTAIPHGNHSFFIHY